MFRNDTRFDEASLPPAPDEVDQLAERARWLVTLRWSILAGLSALLAVALIAGVISAGTEVTVVVAAHALANLGFRRHCNRLGPEATVQQVERFLGLQIGLDLTALLLLLHFTGGADNPFVILTIFSMCLAGMTLPLRMALGVALLAGLLHGGLVLGETYGYLAHYGLQVEPHASYEAAGGAHRLASPVLLGSYLTAFGLAELGLVWLVHRLVVRIRAVEAARREHQRIALSRERMARVGSLAAGVGHAIRNPLQGMMGCVDMLQRRMADADTPTREILELLSEGITRIETVTGRLMVLTRGGPPVRVPVDARTLVQDSLQFAILRAKERQIEVDCDVPDLPPLPLDATRCVEALANLIDNALDATPIGGRVTIRVKDTGRSDPGVEITIRDTGPGIPASDLPRVFDPLFTTKPIGEGTGLGLAIARQVVEDHDGEIRLGNHPSGGAEVFIRLPRPQHLEVAA